jgi:hypothetical protein
MLDERIRQARDEFDLTDPDHQVSVVALAEALLADGVRTGPVDPESPIEARIAGLLADSRRWLSQQTSPLTIGVVFAMWGEQNRLRPRSTENPHGEDSLATKLRQLDWAMRDTPIDWRVYAVDDGCPHGSAPIAAEIAHAHPLGDRVTVLSLADHLPAPSGPLRHLESPEASRKGGAITLGALRAIDDGADAVVYTDADSSVHLGQLGLLLRPFLREGAEVVLGSRKHSRGILDTQAAFKLYESGALRRILADARIFDFSFDTDWILAALQKGYTIEQVAFAFIDSAAESASIAQGPMTTWESLLFGLVRAVRSRGFATGDAAAMAAVIEEEIDGFRDLERIIDRLPRELADAEETDFGDPEIMSPEALRAWLRTVGTGG